MKGSRTILGGVILVYFLIALEVLIMISPFAAFFYAAFNPVLLTFARHHATRWLAAFFLPHMVLPPGTLLKAIRVAGSVLLVAGAATFLICAVQVYTNKIFRKGVALRGLYAVVRHPQYLGLAATGLGLAILWPRFLVVVLWVVMLALYYLLARDEERRMVAAFGDGYRAYMSRTGLVLPRRVEGWLGRVTAWVPARARATVALGLIAALAIGGAFALRAYTVAHLPLWSSPQVTVLAILPGDRTMVAHRMEDVLRIPEIRDRIAGATEPFLVYFMPPQYIMQGMIADTGPQWKLYREHRTAAMIVDWVFHPFRHLQGGGHAMHATGHPMPGSAAGSGMVRRLIFLRVATPGARQDPAELFAVGAARTPAFVADVDVHEARLTNIRDLEPGTGWDRVPTPIF